jgi:hypothetical protein
VPDVDQVEVILAKSDCVTSRVGDAFLKIDADQTRTDIEVEAMALAPVPTPKVLWRKAPALAAVPGKHAAASRSRRPLRLPHGPRPVQPPGRCTTNRCPPLPGKSVDELASRLADECDWLVANEILPADVVIRNRRLAEASLRPWTPAFIHGDLDIEHVFIEGDEITGIIDWSEASQAVRPRHTHACTRGAPRPTSSPATAPTSTAP